MATFGKNVSLYASATGNYVTTGSSSLVIFSTPANGYGVAYVYSSTAGAGFVVRLGGTDMFSPATVAATGNPVYTFQVGASSSFAIASTVAGTSSFFLTYNVFSNA